MSSRVFAFLHFLVLNLAHYLWNFKFFLENKLLKWMATGTMLLFEEEDLRRDCLRRGY
jgi:hypothetical protein